MKIVLALLVSLMWSVVCFRLVHKTHEKVRRPNAPRLVNAPITGAATTLVLGVLVFLVSCGTQLSLHLYEVCFPGHDLRAAQSSVVLMTFYGALKALVCGGAVGLGSLMDRDFGEILGYICLGLACLPIFLFVPLFCVYP